MNKTGQMIEFEEETGEYAIVTVKVGFAELQFPSEVYVEWLEAELLKASVKAAAYDRAMSGGLSMKELANILKHPVAIENEDDQNELYYFDSTPHIGQFSDGTQFWSCKRKWRLPRQLVNFNGNWEDSLAFPDGWEQS
jgi:hypothetical protein